MSLSVSRRHAWRWLPLLLLLSGCLVTGGPTPDVLGPSPTPSAPPLPPVGGRIAFLTDRDAGRRELWVINPDGSHATRLLPGRPMDGVPAWSPDGKRIVYVFDDSGKSRLGVVLLNDDNTPGLSATITADAQGSDNTFPAWSPDGREIAFASNRSGNYQIYTMSSVGGPVSSFPSQPAYAGAPAWSPDGKLIAFVAGADALHAELYMVPAGGGSPTQITNNGRGAALPTWAPDGKSLLFLLQSPDGAHKIAEIRPDGTGQRELTAAPAGVTVPVEDQGQTWSPDGTQIAFFSDRSRNNDIYVMARDGTQLTALAPDPAGDVNPSWAPDSSRLVFSSKRGADVYRLYIVGRDGANLAPLTQGSDAYDDSFPVWSRVR
ncbi:MAG TPA: LpqB family beta-propeller domain-containing protein [Chloroflexia bacterium]|nr:LpqB family beta-propeller domain-containing protein [Chloroflexia bacterium]